MRSCCVSGRGRSVSSLCSCSSSLCSSFANFTCKLRVVEVLGCIKLTFVYRICSVGAISQIDDLVATKINIVLENSLGSVNKTVTNLLRDIQGLVEVFIQILGTNNRTCKKLSSQVINFGFSKNTDVTCSRGGGVTNVISVKLENV